MVCFQVLFYARLRLNCASFPQKAPLNSSAPNEGRVSDLSSGGVLGTSPPPDPCSRSLMVWTVERAAVSARFCWRAPLRDQASPPPLSLSLLLQTRRHVASNHNGNNSGRMGHMHFSTFQNPMMNYILIKAQMYQNTRFDCILRLHPDVFVRPD